MREDLANGGDLNDYLLESTALPVELLDEAKELEKREEEPEELGDVDLAAGSLDKSNDSVRVYLREMGMVPLLTREGEIELAKQIERGEAAVRKALSRSRLIMHLLFETRHNVECGVVSILDVVAGARAATGPRRRRIDQIAEGAVSRSHA